MFPTLKEKAVRQKFSSHRSQFLIFEFWQKSVCFFAADVLKIGMELVIASFDSISEVNMVSVFLLFPQKNGVLVPQLASVKKP